jgi:hypothetical protein
MKRINAVLKKKKRIKKIKYEEYYTGCLKIASTKKNGGIWKP